MKCRCCGDTVRCANCGAKANSSQALAYRRRKQRHVCARCPAPLTAYDLRHDHVHCMACRLRQAERSRARHARCGRKDRRWVA
jgi:REP element-mobilizing transposase RayT